jgi:hypothetical protein
MAGNESDHLQRRSEIRLKARCRQFREHHHERRSGSAGFESKTESICADSDFGRHGAGVGRHVGSSCDPGAYPSAGSTDERRLHDVLLLPSSSQAQRCSQCGTGNRPKSISSTILGTAVRISGANKQPRRIRHCSGARLAKYCASAARQLRQRLRSANCQEARRLTRTGLTAEFNGGVFARRLDSFVSAPGFWHA